MFLHLQREQRNLYSEKRKTDHTLLIGEKGKKANVLLGSLELYCNIFRDDEKFELPDEIIDIIEYDMEMRLEVSLTE